MNCAKLKNLLPAFLEGGLSGSCKEELEAHLKTCAACQKEKDLFLQSWQMLDNYALPKLKDDFTASLMRKIHQEQTEIINVRYQRPWWFVLRPVVPVLASIIILLLTVPLFRKKPAVDTNLVKLTPPPVDRIVTAVNDEEIIKNLDIFENTDLLTNIQFLSELEVVEDLDDSTL